MRCYWGALAFVLGSVLSAVGQCEINLPSRIAGEGFAFALIGDLPYGEGQVKDFDGLIEAINRDPSIRFVLHAGDIKGGGERCDDELILSRFRQFQKFQRAFIYTPGDNEWTDCHRPSNGRYYPLERLDFLRRTFFPHSARSTGAQPIAVLSQASFPGFEPFVENVLFSRSGVLFGTLHVVGSNNDLEPWSGFDPKDSAQTPRPDRIAEFEQRLQATLAWLDVIFAHARQQSAKGVFLLMQANPRFELGETDPGRAGFNAFLSHLKERVAGFDKPVVLAHGDFHEYLIDKPFDREEPRLANFTRIQTFGSPRVNWIKVHVVPHSPSLFVFEQKILEKR
ncbi:MAG: metallophosphoesterase [Methylohalobius sp.]|nr:metallophosphoesterase [Methylohalobius sp.]